MGAGRQASLPVAAALAFALALATWAAPARAQTSTATAATAAATPERALALARAAFEYRDFAQVIRVLDPWVHPPRIQDPQRMVGARRLLGVSLHVRGDERGAREEFAQLLLIDPDHRLDPFVIPPRVIATFEDVRRLLGPRLAPSAPGPSDSRASSPRELVTVPHRAAMWLPLGVPQVLLDESALGIALGAAQLIGLALNVVAYFRGDSFLAEGFTPTPSTEREVWLGLQYGGLAVAGLAYAGSVIHGHVHYGADTPDRPRPTVNAVGQITFRF